MADSRIRSDGEGFGNLRSDVGDLTSGIATDREEMYMKKLARRHRRRGWNARRTE